MTNSSAKQCAVTSCSGFASCSGPGLCAGWRLASTCKVRRSFFLPTGAFMTLAMPRFGHAPVLVVGDVMLDRYWHGGTSRISHEAPGPVVKVEQIEDRPGGAANVALNI